MRDALLRSPGLLLLPHQSNGSGRSGGLNVRHAAGSCWVWRDPRWGKMEPAVGVEPTTDGLQNRCSTTELSRRAIGSYDGVGQAQAEIRGDLLARPERGGQGEKMKFVRLFPLGCGLVFLLGGVVFLLGCAGSGGPSAAAADGAGERYGAGYPPGSARWSVAARTAWRTAFMSGMEDEREGFRYDEDRGALRWEGEERALYRQGYRRGYYHEGTVRRLERAGGAE